LYGIFENAIYGGRIDNETDLRVLRCYLKNFFNEKSLTNGTNGLPSPI
jgi:dynein heavy chain 2